MRHAFDVHNTLGRFLDESVYSAELGRRLTNDGVSAIHEVRARAIHHDFVKEYYMDLIVAEGVIYELKTQSQLVGKNEKQLIHYLLLAGQQHGKLLNFRPASVESRFVSTRLTSKTRKDFKIERSGYAELGERSKFFAAILHGLLSDWGAFLAVELYREAMIHFLGGEETVCQPIDIFSDSVAVGKHSVCLLDEQKAFHLSAVSSNIHEYKIHLLRLLNHTRLRAVQWVNFNRSLIVLETIEKKK